MVSIELDADQLEAVGIAYIKQCYETYMELLDEGFIAEEEEYQIKILEGMLAYVLTDTEREEYYSSLPFNTKQTSLNL